MNKSRTRLDLFHRQVFHACFNLWRSSMFSGICHRRIESMNTSRTRLDLFHLWISSICKYVTNVSAHTWILVTLSSGLYYKLLSSVFGRFLVSLAFLGSPSRVLCTSHECCSPHMNPRDSSVSSLVVSQGTPVSRDLWCPEGLQCLESCGVPRDSSVSSLVVSQGTPVSRVLWCPKGLECLESLDSSVSSDTFLISTWLIGHSPPAYSSDEVGSSPSKKEKTGLFLS